MISLVIDWNCFVGFFVIIFRNVLLRYFGILDLDLDIGFGLCLWCVIIIDGMDLVLKRKCLVMNWCNVYFSE